MFCFVPTPPVVNIVALKSSKSICVIVSWANDPLCDTYLQFPFLKPKPAHQLPHHMPLGHKQRCFVSCSVITFLAWIIFSHFVQPTLFVQLFQCALSGPYDFIIWHLYWLSWYNGQVILMISLCDTYHQFPFLGANHRTMAATSWVLNQQKIGDL